jgi:RNA polymerase sigma-70 factor, ECF subfamily
MMSFVPWTQRRGRNGSSALPPNEQAQALQALARGERQALAQLYQAEAAPVYRYALALCGNSAWAADATQEAFVALATRPQAFDASKGSLGAYLAGVARHALAARWREQRHESPWPDADDEDALAGSSEAADPQTLLVSAQNGATVWAALRRLPAPFCEAVVLVDLQERPYAEAAAIAGVELNTLRTRVHRGRLKLAALLAAPLKEGP